MDIAPEPYQKKKGLWTRLDFKYAPETGTDEALFWILRKTRLHTLGATTGSITKDAIFDFYETSLFTI